MLVTPPVVNDVPQILGRMPPFGRGPIQDRLFGHFKPNARGRTAILYIEGGSLESTLVDWPAQVVPGSPEEGDVFTQAGLAGINYAPGYPFDGLGTAAGWAEVVQRLAAQGKDGIYWVVQGGKVIEVDTFLFANIFQPLGFTEVAKVNSWDSLATSTWDELATSTWREAAT